MLIWPYSLFADVRVYLRDLSFRKSSGSSMIHVVQLQWNYVMYQGTKVGPCKGSGMVNYTLKLSKGSIFISQIKSLGIQLCTIFQLVSSLLMEVVKSQ